MLMLRDDLTNVQTYSLISGNNPLIFSHYRELFLKTSIFAIKIQSDEIDYRSSMGKP
jgi:hypothetical protein